MKQWESQEPVTEPCQEPLPEFRDPWHCGWYGQKWAEEVVGG